MRKRGFIINWQNRHWASITTAYGEGNADPEIPDDGKGELPNFWVIGDKGRGWYYYYDDNDDKVEFLSDIAFISSPFKDSDGTVYRFVVNYHRDLPESKIDVTFGLVDCTTNGRFAHPVSSYQSQWRTTIGAVDRAYTGYALWRGTEDNSMWDTYLTKTPFIEQDTYDMMMSYPNKIRKKCLETTWSGTATSSTFAFRTNGTIWSKNAFYWQTPETTTNEIVARARSLSGYKYWYGGAGQIATKALADSLRAAYPSIWTESYYNQALGDIGQRVGDCSYLVNYAYGTASPGNHGIGTSQYLAKYSRWTGTPKDGMIAWRNGHTGIYAEGKTLELVGINYDYQEKAYDASKWAAILYDPNREY